MVQAIREFESHRFRQIAGFSGAGAARELKPDSGGLGENESREAAKPFDPNAPMGVFCCAAHT